eukprot:TRINITY_DN12124_c0_g1_i2.p1 TRINITY_DN12124_c0_g1~~TRINITY_DN12124_c0_g1_i2.p1  ORF type:complete len:136 (-),score=24.11 TRINITY_DN12124_c0_g1_i2:61-468(-)
MNPGRSKMIVCCFVIVRLLIHKLILNPWEGRSKLGKTELMRRNLKMVGSVLLHLALDMIRTSVPTVLNNQVHLPNSLKVKPRSGEPLKGETERVDPEEIYLRTKRSEVDDIISGLYTREQLAPFFEKRALSLIHI